jgi:hypothetical protein
VASFEPPGNTCPLRRVGGARDDRVVVWQGVGTDVLGDLGEGLDARSKLRLQPGKKKLKLL